MGPGSTPKRPRGPFGPTMGRPQTGKRLPQKGEKLRPSNSDLTDSYDRMWKNQSTDSNN